MGKITFVLRITWLSYFVATARPSAISGNDVCTNFNTLEEHYGRCANYNAGDLSMANVWTGDGMRNVVRVLCNNATDIINCMSTSTAECPDAAFIRERVERMYSFCGSDNWFVNDVGPKLGDNMYDPGCVSVFYNIEITGEHTVVTPSMSVREGFAVYERSMRINFDSFLGHFRRALTRIHGCNVSLGDLFLAMMFEIAVKSMQLGLCMDSDMQNEISALMAE